MDERVEAILGRKCASSPLSVVGDTILQIIRHADVHHVARDICRDVDVVGVHRTERSHVPVGLDDSGSLFVTRKVPRCARDGSRIRKDDRASRTLSSRERSPRGPLLWPQRSPASLGMTGGPASTPHPLASLRCSVGLELLHTLSAVDFARVDVAFRIDGDAVHPVELAGVAA
jgi:hypothetical protein